MPEAGKASAADRSKFFASLSLFLSLLASLGLSWQSNSNLADCVPLFWSFALVMQLAGYMFWRSQTAMRGRVIIALAVLLHAIALCGQPMFEDDYFRYLWDGYQVVANGNPYGVAPESFFADARVPAAMQAVLNGVNNPEVPTIYGPAAQQLFALAYRVDPGNERVLRFLLAACHLGLIALLLRLERVKSLDLGGESARKFPSMLPLYVLNPLVFKEVALTGHFDFLVPLGLIAAWFALQKKLPLLAGMLIGTAIAAKFVAIFALPFFLLARLKPIDSRPEKLIFSKHIAQCVLLILGTTAALALLYLPFLGATDLAGLSVFANDWRFNAGMFALAETATNANTARILGGTILLGVMAFSAWKMRGSILSVPIVCIWLYAALILVGPVINPWYWLWLLPFACLTRQRWPFLLGSVLLLSYGHGLYLLSDSLAPYQLPIWLQCIEHIGIVLILLWQIRHPMRRFTSQP